MIVDPYKRTPVAPTMALLMADGRVVDEHGGFVSLDDVQEVRVWASWETINSLTAAGEGEALCWNGDAIRWRHETFEEGWRKRPSDVSVIKLPLDPDDVEGTLAGLRNWRDWLASNGASPTGTTGSAAWSLLRATLEQTLFCSIGPRPWLVQTLGGRQLLGPHGQGRYQGTLEHWDLPAAYASTLGGLPYGGRWYRLDELPQHEPAWWAEANRCVFVRCRLSLPDGLTFGPLPRRPRRRMSYMESMLLGADYPSQGSVQGVWTWQEVEAAIGAGARLERLYGGWVHISAQHPFEPWWQAVQSGRATPGLGGVLAKMTGNALWGRFCLDPRAGGVRVIRRRDGETMVQRGLKQSGGQPPAHDLAETVSGRVRARLFTLLSTAGENVVSAHTDGAWLRQGPFSPEEEWRLKGMARRLDVIGPQVLRYWPSPPAETEPWVVYSGVTAEQAPAAFESDWVERGLGAVA